MSPLLVSMTSCCPPSFALVRIWQRPILARALPQLRAFSLFAQDAHWQVTGPLFGVLHPLFGDLYDLATGYADAVAERIAQLGNVPPAASKIVALPIDATQGSLVAAQCARHAQRLGSLLYEAMDQIKDIDPVFLAKFQDWQGATRKANLADSAARGLKRAVALVHFAIARLPISALR